MSSFEEAFLRLSSLTNYERLRPDLPYRFDLTGMEDLCRRLGHPERNLRLVAQVGGSKGKGTVAHLLAGLGKRLGLEVALYTSPHVLDVRERILYQLRMAPEEALAASISAVVEELEPGQTWFEAFTAAALLYFSSLDPDLSVFEVGLGGRLDSTSVIPKQASCITGIEKEHTQVLGERLEEIAGEKAGILRPGVPCVTGAGGRALEVIRRQAGLLSSPLRILGEDFHLRVRERTTKGFLVEIAFEGGRKGDFELPVLSRAQAFCFALALALLGELFPDLVEPALHLDPDSWLPDALPPGRFQVLSRDPPLVVDGAHTDESLAVLGRDLREAFPGWKFRLVFGVARGKRWRRGLGRLAPLVDRAWVAPLDGKVSEPSELVRDRMRDLSVPCELSPSVTEALREAHEEGGALLVAGSLYAAGEALKFFPSGR